MNLIERLEKATGPSRELDGRIWAEIDGRDVRVVWCEHWGRNGLLAKSRRAPLDECVVGVFDCEDDTKLYTVGQSNPPPNYTASIDAALTLLPPTATNHNLFSFVGHGREGIGGHAWGFKFHDTTKLVGAARAKQQVKRLKLSPVWSGAKSQVPTELMENAIAEQFMDFYSTHAATPAIALCIAALRARATGA